MTTNYTREEEERLVRALRRRPDPRCPRCGARMARQDVSPTEGLPYVRSRVWLTCEACRRSVVVDRRRTRDEPEP